MRFIGIDRGHSDNFEDALSVLEEIGGRPAVIDLLRPVLPLKDLRILLRDGEPVLYVEDAEGGRAWPAISAGDGIKRLLLMAMRLGGRPPGGIALIEDPEAFQHPRSIRQVAALLLSTARAGTQVFVTTHSVELIHALVADINGGEQAREVAVFLVERGAEEPRKFSGAQFQAFGADQIRRELGHH